MVENSIYAIDLSSRVQRRIREDDTGFQQALGLDYYSKLNTEYRDVATVIFQPYLVRLDNYARFPAHFDDDDDWEFIPRICNLNLHLTDERWLNLKLGHMEIPYGPEVPINSNGTLRQFLHPQNFGMKADWGFSLNGTLDPIQYEFALTRGSGIEFNSGRDPFAVSGRVGNAIDAESYYGFNSFGISFFRGDVLTRTGAKIQRSRVGLDGQYYHGPMGVVAEVSAGQNDDTDVVNTLVELNYVNRRETIFLYNQVRLLRLKAAGGWNESDALRIGVRYTPDNRWALSSELTQELNAFGNLRTETLLFFQLRYRL
ncbi:MAG: hypothetical protein ACPGVU_05775 [Limisphaerales bacterium]